MLAAGARVALAPRASRARASSPGPARTSPFASASPRGRRRRPEGGEDADASTTRVASGEGDELLDAENQPSFSNRWSGSDDEDDSHAAARAARVAAASHGQVWDSRPDVVHPERDPHPPPDTGSVDPKTYSDEDIATMQVDALKHAAVVDSVTARLDREEKDHREKNAPRYAPPATHFPAYENTDASGLPLPPTPEFSSLRHVNEEGRRPPHVAVPTDASSKACVCRYTYDRNVLDHLGEDYVLERYDPLETAALHDDPNAAIENLVPFSVRRACRADADAAFANVVLAQGFDWTSAKRFSGPSSFEEGPKKDDASYWKWLTERVCAIAELGITHLWLPPPSHSASPEGYLPGRLFQLDASRYGTKADLKALCAALRERGVTPVCDVVINHRTADARGVDGAWNVFADLDADGEPIHWGDWAITCDDPAFFGKGGPDSGENYGPAPDLDHANPELRFALKRWMAWLRDEIGFGGFRFDFVRGFAPEYVEEYIRSAFPPETANPGESASGALGEGTTKLGDETCEDDAAGAGDDKANDKTKKTKAVLLENPAFHVGENWVDMHWEGATLSYDQDGPRSRLVDWIADTHGSCALFDFPTKGILQRAVTHAEFWRLRDNAGRPPGLLGWVPARAVTFLENHDTGPPQNHWPFPADRLGLGYAYVLTHPGIPCVFGPHAWGNAFGNDEDAFARVEKSDEKSGEKKSAEGSDSEDSEGPGSLGDVISRLLALRARHGIRADAHVKILAAESDLYVARVAHRLTVKLGPRYDVPAAIAPREPEWRLALSGDDWAVWERASYEGGEPREAARKTENFEEDEEDDGAAAEAVRRVCGAVRATDEDALLFDAAAPVLVGGALDEAADPASVGSFFEAPTSGFVKPAASWDEEDDEQDAGYSDQR